MSNGYKYLNGVKMYETKDGDGRNAVTYYSDDPDSVNGLVSFKSYINSDNQVVISGNAYGQEAADKVRKMFPNMELKPTLSSDGDVPDNFPCYSFHVAR
jgi:hypothetical protein